MSEPWTNRVVAGGSGRVFRMVVSRPSLPAKILMVLLLLLLLVLLAVVVIPIALIGGVVALGAIGAMRVRGWLRGVRAPNGMLDERRNVRVIVRE